jgi:hypothetical protein
MDLLLDLGLEKSAKAQTPILLTTDALPAKETG